MQQHGILTGCVCVTLDNSMAMGKLGQAFTAKEIFDLVKADLKLVEAEIALESVSSVDAITTIGRYLQASGGKRLRPSLLLLSSKLIGAGGESPTPPRAAAPLTPPPPPAPPPGRPPPERRARRPSTNPPWGK